MAMRGWIPLCARLADAFGVSSRSVALTLPQQSPRAAVEVRHFASGEGASLRQSADHHLQDGAPESQPRPDSTAINQKAPLSADEEGKPQVGKVSTPEDGKEGSSEASSAGAESDDTIPNLQTPKDK